MSAAEPWSGALIAARSENGAVRVVLVGDAGDVDPPPEPRLHIAVLPRERTRPLHVRADAGIAREVCLDVPLRHSLGNAELAGKAERRDPVDDAEVDRLGAPPSDRVHAVQGHPEHLAGGQRVDVGPCRERLLERLDPRHVREKPQLDLRIVGRYQHMVALGDEGAADGAPLIGADGDVLKVRVDAGEPAGGSPRHAVGRVDATRLRVDLPPERVGVGRAELRHQPPVQDALRKLMAFGSELLQDVGVGAPCLGARLPAAPPGPSPRTARRRAASASRR